MIDCIRYSTKPSWLRTRAGISRVGISAAVKQGHSAVCFLLYVFVFRTTEQQERNKKKKICERI